MSGDLELSSRLVVERVLCAIAEEQFALSEATPEGVSTDWAFEHGWISGEEYGRIRQQWALADKQVQRDWASIQRVARALPQAFGAWFRQRISALERQAARIEDGTEQHSHRSIAAALHLALGPRMAKRKGYLNHSFLWAFERVDRRLEAHADLLEPPGRAWKQLPDPDGLSTAVAFFRGHLARDRSRALSSLDLTAPPPALLLRVLQDARENDPSARVRSAARAILDGSDRT
ncbi:MAG: hypothetical protein EP330_13870 [Deltaproteobacteria bacterium]|nr:MAG: hypothetical protein EP330_13870 [Deltaproteobacteria bacterium]